MRGATQSSAARFWLALVVPLTLMVLAGCGSGASEADSRRTNLSPGSAGTSTGIVPLRFSDLVAPPDVSFAVAFSAEGLYFNAPERFVWRQGSGLVRWDIVASRSGEPDTGWISIESEARADEGYYGMGCLWHRQTSLAPDGTPQARVSCADSGSVAEGSLDLSMVMLSSFDERLPDQTIAGRKASCYSFDDPAMSVAVFCVDSSRGIPLLLSTVGRTDPRLTQEMRALSVSTESQELGFPIELEKDPVGWQFEGMVPISTLQLPDFSQFEQ